MMYDSASANLVRYRPAVLVLAGAAAAASIIYLHSAYQTHLTPTSPTSSLRRSNAVHRPRPRSVTVEAEPHADGPHDVHDASDAVTELGLPEDTNAELEAEGQRMHELMFAISKNRARTEAVVHRRITCDSCNRAPIKGVRYRCANCPDFDLCEDCEAQDAHIATHVFYKIKVPAPWAGKVPQRPWYPGRPWTLPDTMPSDLKQRLVDKYPALQGQSARFEGMYQQFVCIANVDHPNDPCQLNAAIDRRAFNECFVPQSSPRLRSNLVLDRLFRLFDSNRDSLIDFDEFSRRLSDQMANIPMERKLKDCFTAMDLNDDGRVSRNDCLTFFRAQYDLERDIALDRDRMCQDGESADELTERKAPVDFIRGGRCLSAYFDYYTDDFASNPRHHEGKLLDTRGDLVPERDDFSLLHGPEDGLPEDASGDAGPNFAVDGEFCRELDRIARTKPDGNQVYDGTAAKYLNRDPHRPDVMLIKTEIRDPQPYHSWEYGDTLWMFLRMWQHGSASMAVYVSVQSSHVDAAHNAEMLRLVRDEAEARVLRRISGIRRGGRMTGIAEARQVPASKSMIQKALVPDRLCLGIDSTASDTIRDVIAKALNDMLDPVFKRDELRHLAFVASAAVRKKYAAAIDDFHRKIGVIRGRGVYTVGFFDPKLAEDAQDAVMEFRSRQGKTGFDEVTVGDLRYDNLERVYEVDMRSLGSVEEDQRPAWVDMTMPQNKPESDALPGRDPESEHGKVVRYARMLHVLAALQYDKRDPDPFVGISFERFADAVRAADERKNNNLSLRMCSWLDNIVLF